MKASISTKLSRFFAEYPLKRYAKGDIILFADNTVPPVMHIVKGKVAQYDIAENGNKAMLNVFQSPAFLPMMNAINNKPNRHFYEALTDSQVRLAPAEDVVQFLKGEPDVTYDLLARLYSGVDGLLGKVTQLMAGTALELSIAAQRFGTDGPDGSKVVKSTETQLAHQTGLARETVSRELQKLKKDGLINTSKGVVIVNSALSATLPV
jgi:CRP-like cAMP-binding protein